MSARASPQQQSAWSGEKPHKTGSPTTQQTPPHSVEAEKQQTLPHSVEAEQAVLSCLLQWPRETIADCAVKIGKEYFYVDAHRTIYQALLDQWDADEPIDLITFTQVLRDKQLLDHVGGPAFVTNLQTFIPTSAAIDYYLQIVREKYVRRQAIAAYSEAVKQLHNDQGDHLRALDKAEAKLASLRSLHGPNGATPKSLSWEELRAEPDLEDALLENRALERGQGALLFGPSGCGKSTLATQVCCCWSAGMAGAHIAPVKPLKIAILQTEDSLNDLREYCKGILTQKCFTSEKIALIEKNLIVLEPVPGGSPDYLCSLLDRVAQEFAPDLISLNPLLAFCTADYTRELGSMLYTVIDPIIKKHRIGFLGVHHTPKPFSKSGVSYGAYDYQYIAAGDARIANWPRLSLQIEPISASPVLTACFRIAKRWQRIAWLNEHGEPTRERFLKHSSGKIWWCDASEAEADLASVDEDSARILDILPLPPEPGIIREEVRLRAKNKLKIGKTKADDFLKIELRKGMVIRGEIETESKRKTALFRRMFE
jgi:hypothetical protein